MTIKLLNNNEITNIMKNEHFILCEKLIVENHRGCCRRNFAR